VWACDTNRNLPPKEKFSLIVEFLKALSFDKEAVEWEHYEKSSQYSALNIRPILLNVRMRSAKYRLYRIRNWVKGA
jgi:hypothetical protein